MIKRTINSYLSAMKHRSALLSMFEDATSFEIFGMQVLRKNDMIFSIICEEMGIFGGIALVLLFLMLLWRMMVIANNAPDLFGSLLVVGVMAHIAIQVILNRL